ncbi:MAG: hypothetical protein CTY10_06345 [Methylotenera sp.]|nr:MAG: hypothetical protein CTY10_06345 [Methylotenera sp.]
MVDLPTSQTLMRKTQKQGKYIDPDAFHLARRQAGLTVSQAAIELDVTERTIRNYENGAVSIPYPCFRLMRLLGGYSLIARENGAGSDWGDWSFWQNKLWSPEGRSFEVHHLRYLSLYMQVARRALSGALPRPTGYACASQLKSVITAVHDRAASEQPSSATALFGAKVAQRPVVNLEALQACNDEAA